MGFNERAKRARLKGQRRRNGLIALTLVIIGVIFVAVALIWGLA